MNNPTRFLRTAVLGTLLAAAVFLFGTIAVSAQPIAWSPPCAQTKIVNRTNCRATLTLMTPTGIYGPVTVGAGVSIGVNTPPPLTFISLLSQAGTWVPIVSPGPAMPPPGPLGPTTGWVNNITLAPMGCCFNVYFHAPTCTIWLFPGTPPPPCTP